MRMNLRAACRLVLLLAGSVSARAQFEAVIPWAPAPMHANDQAHLVYEIHFTNFVSVTSLLERVEISSQTGARLATYVGQELADALDHPGFETGGSDTRVLGPGLRMILFVWLTWKWGEAIPTALTHHLVFSAPSMITKDRVELTLDVSVPVRKDEPILVGAPLRGSGWVAGNGPSNRSPHRRKSLPFGPRATVAERFAYDFVRVGESGIAFEGDQSQNRSWYGYGAEVFAATDGIVHDTHDGLPENIPLAKPSSIPTAASGGNFVSIDLGKGRYAFYAHLQPGSLRVKAGDRVRRGQLLGLLGNSGNSDLPHLHFQISTAGKLDEGEGLPFDFEAFELVGHSELVRAVGVRGKPAPWNPGGLTRIVRRQMPLADDIIGFH